jgi:O-antigen/teichoic acid export membrane protein
MTTTRRGKRPLLSPDILTFSRSALVKGLVLGLNFAQAIILARWLHADAYGLYAAVYVNLTIGIALARGPIELLVQRSGQIDSGAIELRYRSDEFRRVFLIGGLLGTATFAFITFTQGLAIGAFEYALLLVGIALSSLSGVRRAELMLRGRTDRIDILDLLVRPMLFLAMVGVAHFMNLSDDLTVLLLGLSFVLALTLPNLRSLRHTLASARFGNVGVVSDWVKYSSSVALSALTKTLDVILVTYLIGGAAVGSYFLLTRMADVLAFGSTYANLRYTHRFARSVRDGDWPQAQRIMARAMALSGGVAAVGAVLALGLGTWLLPLIQPGLDGWMGVFAILIVAQVVNGVCGPNGSFLGVLQPGQALLFKFISAAALLAIMPVTILAWGPIGAAIATAGSVILLNLLTMIALLRRLRTGEVSSAEP